MNTDNESTEQPMQADQEDRHFEQEETEGGLPVIPIIIGVGLLVAAAAWFLFSPDDAPPPPPPPAAEITPAEPPALPEPVAPPEPDIPEPEVIEDITPEPNEPPPPPPLTLDESDPVVRNEMAPLLADTDLANTLDNDQLLDRMAGLIDATSQGRVFHEVFKLPPPEEKFAVIQQGDTAYIDPASYSRYDGYTQAIATLDTGTLATAFNTFRPLLEEAYAALGYKEQQLDNTLIRALDQVIEAPTLEGPAALEKDVTTWHYVDPELEALSPLAKQLLRMGPENQALLQAQARALREELLNQ
ncbi:DUF3014 domain-containing protein [Halioglobus maricola]|uniref:DUF3014 domain-containing protein n=1 Tax=Halioglobus maricola TaxID=2601894 RepID=A0A5P9NH68_9GAMM|nr:DUF3014 domain-containing protein [Halioglobus maricola]QFU74875.1 DUF3014 domain-containing protein [Halioglobus maricola]